MIDRHDVGGTVSWMREGTAYVVHCVGQLDDELFAEPSGLRNWTRAHVVAHLARNAEALTRLVTWARTGVETPMYADRDQRAAEIETSASRLPTVLRAELTATADDLARALGKLSSRHWAGVVRSALGRAVPAAEIPWMRVREVWTHAVDLNAGATFADFPAGVVDLLLDDVTAALSTKPGCPAALLTPSDRTTIWQLGPAPAEHIIKAPAAVIAGWLTGRAIHPEWPVPPAWL